MFVLQDLDVSGPYKAVGHEHDELVELFGNFHTSNQPPRFTAALQHVLRDLALATAARYFTQLVDFASQRPRFAPKPAVFIHGEMTTRLLCDPNTRKLR